MWWRVAMLALPGLVQVIAIDPRDARSDDGGSSASRSMGAPTGALRHLPGAAPVTLTGRGNARVGGGLGMAAFLPATGVAPAREEMT